MRVRLAIVLALLSALLAGPSFSVECPAKVSKPVCHCCNKVSHCCGGMSAQSECAVPVPHDRAAQLHLKPVCSPVLFSTGNICFFVQDHFFPQFSKSVEVVYSPPPLELNCIRLI